MTMRNRAVWVAAWLGAVTLLPFRLLMRNAAQRMTMSP